MLHVLTVDIPDDEAESFDFELTADPPDPNTVEYSHNKAHMRLAKAFADRDKTDSTGQVPVIVWLTPETIDGFMEYHCGGGSNWGPHASTAHAAWHNAVSKAHANLPRPEPEPETRSLQVDDQWVDDDGDEVRCERIDPGSVLVSWLSDGDAYRQIVRRQMDQIIGQKRADGSLIGAPEVSS